MNFSKFFNIYINDMFYLFDKTYVCNMADDTTPYACDVSLPRLLHNLEEDVSAVVSWFAANFMILNPDKCHFIIGGPRTAVEQLFVRVGGQVVWESVEEILLGVTVNKNLKFEAHVSEICKKASGKLTALARMARIMPLYKKKILMSSFVQSQFSYCTMLWMFCSRNLNDKINRIQERALRLVYRDKKSTFEELLNKDNSVKVHVKNLQIIVTEMFKVKKKVSKCFLL